MGYMKEERILDFLRDLKENLIKYEDDHGDEFGVYFDDDYVRYGSKIANLQTMIYNCEDPADAFDPADCTLEEFYDDPYIDIYISCEGRTYEAVYGYVSRGGDERKKDLHDAFNDAAENNGLTMDFCGGALGFTSEESFQEQNKKWEGKDMIHYLESGLFDQIVSLKNDNGKRGLAWRIILADDTLCPVLRRDRIDIYYRGFKTFSLSGNGISRNHEQFDNDLYMYDIPECIADDEFPSCLPLMKQNIDLWMGAGTKSPYEREFMQMIMRENNSEKAGNLSDYFIIDMEHQYEKGGAIPDLIGLIMERGKRQKPVFRMSIIEVKYMDRAFSGVAGIQSHIKDYVRLVSDENLLKEVKTDISEMFFQSKMLGLLPGLKNQYDRIEISNEKPELLFALLSRNTNNGRNNRQNDVEDLKTILGNVLSEDGNMLDDVYVAGTAEMGFGLYSDRKTKLKEFYECL